MATLSPEEFNAKLNAAPQAPVEPEEEKQSHSTIP